MGQDNRRDKNDDVFALHLAAAKISHDQESRKVASPLGSLHRLQHKN